LASKGYFAGEAAGLRLAYHQGTGHLLRVVLIVSQPFLASDVLDKPPPQNAPSEVVEVLKSKMADTFDTIRNRNSNLMVQDLKRLLFRCATTLISLEDVCGLFVH